MEQVWKQPIYVAAENGHADGVDDLLCRGNCDFIMIIDDGTPLHVAVKKRHTQVVEIILKHSCRIFGKLKEDETKRQEKTKNLAETKGIMPIELSKLDGRRVCAGIVWTEKSRPTPLETMLDLHGHTALELAVKSIQPKMVEILLNAGRCVYSEKHLGNSFRCMIETIGSANVQFHDFSNIKNRNIMNILWNSIKEIAQLLMDSSIFNVNHQNDDFNTLLCEAIKQCACPVFDNLTRKSRLGRLRIQTKLTDSVMQLLLEKGADFNMKNDAGETPLIIASQQGCSHAIEMLFEWEQKSGLTLNRDARDQYGATALIKTAEMHHVSAMRLLLSHRVSGNLHDYYGFTALHAAVYEPNRNWCDLHFFCNGLLKRKHDSDEYLSVPRCGGHPMKEEQTVDSNAAIDELRKKFENVDKATRVKEEMVKLLLAINDLNVNALDFKGRTPLDLAVKSCKRITLETFKALEDHGAIRNLLEPIDEAPIGEARFDERGRNPLHRLIISLVSNYAVEDMKVAKREKEHEWYELMVHGFFLKPGNFRQSANATDDKRRTPLHYAAMPPSYVEKQNRDIVMVLLKIGSKANAVDMYGKTPLHYAETKDMYKFLVQHGADESIEDKNGHTPKDLRQLRESVSIDIEKTQKFLHANKELFISRDVARVIGANYVTELSNRNLFRTVRIYSQSRRPKESSKKAIAKVWVQNKLFSLNKRVGQLKPPIQCFIDRLAEGIKKKDGRFECQPILVGSAEEGTKVVISGDFDFNFKLTKFSQICDVFPHPLGPTGYFQLIRKSDHTEGRKSDGEFDCFFNSDQCLLTNEVNSRFQIILEDVLHDPDFWQNEHLFEWNLTDKDKEKSEKPAGLCKTVRLRMLHPIDDGKGDFLFVNVSIDVVACVCMEDVWLGEQLPDDNTIPAGKADGCTLVFDRPRFDPPKLLLARYAYSDTFSKISFAPLESRFIKESPSLIKAAFIVCKWIINGHPKTTYQLKTSILFCTEAFKNLKGIETKNYGKLTQMKLAFWVERLLFCFIEFYRHDVYPCYFMPSFRQQVVKLNDYQERSNSNAVRLPLKSLLSFKYSAAFEIYLDLCPNGTAIDIPVFERNHTYITEESRNAKQDPQWKQFDRREFIKKLSSRSFIH